MQETIGTCRFCGQRVVIVVPDEATEEMMMEEATRNCKCPDAKYYREELEAKEQIEMAKESAKGTIFELFHEDYPEIEELFNNSMNDLVSKKYKKITVNTGGKTKATMSFAKDTIKVEREEKSSYVRETEL